MGTIGIRGAFFDLTDDPWPLGADEAQAARFEPDGLLVVEDGIISAFGPYEQVGPQHPGLEITTRPGRLILPGFVDGHVHVPQTRILGAYGEELLPWLEKWVFPEERKYSDRGYARRGARLFFDALLAAGTTTCQAFTTTHKVAVEEVFEEALRRDMRIIAGLTGIDRNAPADYVDTAENFHRDSETLIARYHRNGRALYAITPRFALGASPDLLDSCARLKQAHPDCWVNTHISENPGEIRAVRALYPEDADYLAIYERYGLVGPKFSGGHGVHLSDDEFTRLSRSGAALTFCPCSNLYLGSGLFRLGRAKDPRAPVRLSFGSDVGGGNRFSMLSVLEDAYKIGMCNATRLEDAPQEAERNRLSPYRAFWSITLGGARALYLDDMIGNFVPGKEADFVVLDWTAGPEPLAWRQSLVCDGREPQTKAEAAALLFGLMMVGDARAVAETWVMGRRLYRRDEAPPRPLGRLRTIPPRDCGWRAVHRSD